jgi:coniferyl-aldehyde dehydrogenase
MTTVKLSSEPPRPAAQANGDLLSVLEKQRAAFLRDGAPGYDARMEAIEKLRIQIKRHTDAIADAICADFGTRARQESILAEVFITLSSIKHTRKHLKKWMADKKAPIDLQYRPARGKIHYQPLGVVGIISPWNYPLSLALIPVVQALSAGNRIMLKPSELTPKTSSLIKSLLAEVFTEAEVSTILGGPDVGAAFAALPFDHLFYTGSTRIGRLVMMAAAPNLCPVTLELGGKSPCIVGKEADVERSVKAIMGGKLVNAGQTCVAPDYCFVPKERLDDFLAAAQSQAATMYPSLANNDQYTSIVSDGHYERITRLIDDARQKGAKVIEVNPKHEPLKENRKIAPTFVLNVTEEMDIMQEEIFGPVLPIKTYSDASEPIRYINDHPRPLALYYFGTDKQATEAVVRQTTAGGMCVNDTILHLAQEELPFGGVGPSGHGAYHGFKGFETFSHAKSVFYQTRLTLTGKLRAPYGPAFDRLINFLMKGV